jgi:hypothetical protein
MSVSVPPDDQRQPSEQFAHDYLADQLGPRAPATIQFESEFDEAPLEGEGPACLFSFDLAVGNQSDKPGCAASDARHYVVAGATQPNFFPSYGLSPDEGYSFHVGTQFMLGMGIHKVDDSHEPPGAREAMRAFVASYARGVAINAEQLAGLFRCEEAIFAVYRLQLDEQHVYCLGADCPPGFYTLTENPPQMVLRLHLGNMIRAEAQEGRRRKT